MQARHAAAEVGSGEGLLVFGRTGQLARALADLAPDACYAGRDMADLSDPAACAALIAAMRPRVVINAAAWTAVDAAEAAPEDAQTVNAAAPGAMATACAAAGIPFLHVSTDYVFDGTGARPWREDDEAAPLNAYGRCKRAGEMAVAAAGGQWAVLRSAWVFAGTGRNFVTTMLRLGAERARLTVVDDQIGCPTPAQDLAVALLAVADGMLTDPARGGLYHFAGQPAVSWAGFAREIMDRAGLPAEVAPILTSDYPTPARRPLNGRLDCNKILRDFAIAPPDWRARLGEMLADWKGASDE